jgi:hypothetical protein
MDEYCQDGGYHREQRKDTGNATTSNTCYRSHQECEDRTGVGSQKEWTPGFSKSFPPGPADGDVLSVL